MMQESKRNIKVHEIYHKLSHAFNELFTRDNCIFLKEETIDVQLLLMLENIINNRKKRSKGYREITMENNALITRDNDFFDISTAVRILMNNCNIKIKALKMGKVKLKILDYKENPFYLRKFNPSSIEEEVLINISGWDRGVYNILLTTLLGVTIASGKFEIY